MQELTLLRNYRKCPEVVIIIDLKYVMDVYYKQISNLSIKTLILQIRTLFLNNALN
jgi:hypothetical protein